MNFLWICSPVIAKGVMLYYLLISNHFLRGLIAVMDIVTKIELDVSGSITARSYFDKFEVMPLEIHLHLAWG